MPSKTKLSFSPTNQGLNTALAGLDSAGLPEGTGRTTPLANAAPKKPKMGRVVLRREKAHRGGKTVIVIHDFAPHIGRNYLEMLAGKLKSACACGGTVRERTVEIQGDQPGRIRSLLESEGFQVAGVS